MIRALGIVSLVFLAGCLQNAPNEPADAAGADVRPPMPAWLDVQAAPEGFAGSEVSMAIDPTDPLHVVASAHAGGFGVYESYDGGQTWTAERLTAQSLFGLAEGAPGTALQLSDPAVAFSSDGTLHIAGLAYLPASAVFVATRDASGWRADTVWQSEIVGTFNDKEWLGINPATNTMIVAWQREPALDSLRAVDQASGGAVDADAGLVVFSRSTDGGATWSLPEQVSHGLHANGTQVVFAPDGTGYMAWVDYEDPHLDVLVSRDDGATWGALSVPSDISIVGSFAQFDRMHTLPGLSVARDGLNVFLVWHDDRAGDADVMLAHSADGAATWTTHRVPDGDVGNGNVQLYPWVASDRAGAHITYYGAHNGTRDFAYRYTAFDSLNGTFTEPVDVSNSTFAIFAEGGGPANIGDYTATAVAGDRVYAAWAHPTKDGSYIHVASR